MNQLASVREDAGSVIESVIVKGDLGKLTPAERSRYYVEVCQSVGLNPLTKPFEYIVLNGKLTLYALRNCTDQLRTIHEVSVEDLAESERDGVFVVTAKVRNGKGRTDMAKGAVTIGNLKGDALANAMMKAETKAKRRATLSICGLGFLDETEIETIPSAAPPPQRKSSAQAKRDDDWPKLEHALADCGSAVAVDKLQRSYQENEYTRWSQAWREQADEAFDKRRMDFGKEPGEALNLREQLAGSLEGFQDRPTTRANYVQWCHDHIETLQTEESVNAWWEEEAAARKRFRLTPAEETDLKARAKARIKSIRAKAEQLAQIAADASQTTFVPNARERMKDKAGNELHPIEAG